MAKKEGFLDAAYRFGTPLYVYDKRKMEEQCLKLKLHFPGFLIRYAMKANSNPAILEILRRNGMGVEAVSLGELALARTVGFTQSDTSYTCSNQTPEELRKAAKLSHVHLDSLRQLEAWGQLRLGKTASIRVNLGIGAGHHEHVITGGPLSKFGITAHDLPEAMQIAARYDFRITGIQQHIGSNVLQPKPFLTATKALLAEAAKLPHVTHIDFGGGFGVPYRPEEKELDLKKLGAELTYMARAFERKHGRHMTFVLEPGRYLVAQAGSFLVSVVDKKTTGKRFFIGVNSGFNHLIRPAMYGSYHSIRNLSRKGGKPRSVSVAGYVCETGDVFAHERMLGEPQIGDILAIENAGAYGFSMASTYNLRRLPKEVLITAAGLRDISFSPHRYAR